MVSLKARAAAAALCCAVAAPLAASPMVVRAVGPSAEIYKPGQKLAEDAQLVLRAGDQLTVLDARGTRSFTGPRTVRLDSASTAANQTAFAELLTQKSERRARIGAVRGAAPEPVANPLPPGVWAISTVHSGTVCALDLTRLSLWRVDPLAAATVNVARAGSAPVAVTFPAGSAITAWPAELAAADGDRFTIAGAAVKPVQVTLRKLPAGAQSVDGLAAALMDAGCQSQFERLAAVTKVADETPAS